MAQKVTTSLIDDLDGSIVETGAGRTVAFSFDGADYEIDLTDRNLSKITEAFSDYVAAARRVRGGRPVPSAPSRARSADDLSAIRTWAAANGYTVSGRGRIAQTVKAAYYKALK